MIKHFFKNETKFELYKKWMKSSINLASHELVSAILSRNNYIYTAVHFVKMNFSEEFEGDF